MTAHRGTFRGHAVIVGMVDLVRSTLPGLQVLDGPRTAEELEDVLVVVGWDPDAQASLVERRDVADPGLCDDPVVRGEVACFVTALRGDADMGLARAASSDVLAVVELALRDDRTGLGGACDSAAVGPQVVLAEFQTGKGAEARLSFSVTYEAFL